MASSEEKMESYNNWKKSVVLYLHDLIYMLIIVLVVFLLFLLIQLFAKV